MSVVLNIGLEAFENDRVVAIDEASLQADLARTFRDVVAACNVVESHTERTLVVVVEHWEESRAEELYAIYQLAIAFNQDAIAYYDNEDGYGEFIGPAAKAWGPFNSEFFFLPDGRSLNDHIVEQQIEEVTNV